MYLIRFKSGSNSLIRINKYNWIVESEYRDGTGDEYFSIFIDPMGEDIRVLYNNTKKYLTLNGIKIKLDVSKIEDIIDGLISFNKGLGDLYTFEPESIMEIIRRGEKIDRLKKNIENNKYT